MLAQLSCVRPVEKDSLWPVARLLLANALALHVLSFNSRDWE